jgi:tetratricopeptide (TPR) repeat protein
MDIYHKVDEFLKLLFEGIDIEDHELVKHELKRFYTLNGIEPEVYIEGGWATITIDTQRLEKQEKQFDKVLKLCDQQQFDKAEPLLSELIKNNPTYSEFYRVKGQIESETGRPEEAVNSLIDALRWDPSNKWALIMMGNVFYKQRNDFETALIYFNKALEVD